MVEHLTCNQTVVGSIPTTSSIFYGKFAERPNATDCKSVDFVFGGSNPPLPTKKIIDQTDVWSIFFDANGMASNHRSVSSCCRPRPQQVAPRRNAKKCYQHFFIFFAPHNFPPKRRINASLFFLFTPSLITKYNDISDGVVEIKTTGR